MARAPAASIAAAARSISRRCAAAGSFVSCLWSQVWLPISCPSAAMRATTAGCRSTFCPRRKNVAGACTSARASSSRLVSRPGPSSKVSATHFSWAQSTLPPSPAPADPDAAGAAGSALAAGDGVTDDGVTGDGGAVGPACANAARTRRPASVRNGSASRAGTTASTVPSLNASRTPSPTRTTRSPAVVKVRSSRRRVRTASGTSVASTVCPLVASARTTAAASAGRSSGVTRSRPRHRAPVARSA